MHTIGAFALIFDTHDRILLCHRTDRDAWNLPGGLVESHEAPWETVVREVEEEVGLRVQVRGLQGVYAVPEKSDLVLNFFCVVVGGDEARSGEADDIRWFERDDLPINTLPRHAQRIHDAYALRTEICFKTQA